MLRISVAKYKPEKRGDLRRAKRALNLSASNEEVSTKFSLITLFVLMMPASGIDSVEIIDASVKEVAVAVIARMQLTWKVSLRTFPR